MISDDVRLPLGEHCRIRLLEAADEEVLKGMFARCSADDVHLRCFAAMKDFPGKMAARLARMDPAEEIGLVATPLEGEAQEILGVAHVILDHEEVGAAEFDVMVRSDQKGHGIGYALMTALLDEARRRGFKAVVGYVLRENRSMMLMCGELGFLPVRYEGAVTYMRVDLTTVELPPLGVPAA